MWLLEGGGVIVRRRERVKQAPHGPAPLSNFSHGASTSEEGVDKGRGGQICEVALDQDY